ncbi:hypothetical protein GGF37_003616 [Kickxella alabastrina]|nr:hypothetical protein GGF37_003616 [Kickxella alabastrina]
MSKNDFIEHLDTSGRVLIGFYEEGQEESSNMLSELSAFCALAADKHPDLQVSKINYQKSPYLTARLLLTSIPELRLLAKTKSGKWEAQSIDVTQTAEELIEYMDSQAWVRRSSKNQGQTFCTPFNVCGQTLGFIAEKSIALDSALPIPKWLAMILVPALITIAGRFIIDGMYSFEEWVRAWFKNWNTDTSGVSAVATVAAAKSVKIDKVQ